mmetsp:Transcript_102046/g.327448  ORF Transcript_102046/g.327448 Transcript_102046/m.327448 type:complete len:382 (-) Transcript_102046:2137-3282(-)
MSGFRTSGSLNSENFISGDMPSKAIFITGTLYAFFFNSLNNSVPFFNFLIASTAACISPPTGMTKVKWLKIVNSVVSVSATNLCRTSLNIMLALCETMPFIPSARAILSRSRLCGLSAALIKNSAGSTLHLISRVNWSYVVSSLNNSWTSATEMVPLLSMSRRSTTCAARCSKSSAGSSSTMPFFMARERRSALSVSFDAWSGSPSMSSVCSRNCRKTWPWVLPKRPFCAESVGNDVVVPIMLPDLPPVADAPCERFLFPLGWVSDTTISSSLTSSGSTASWSSLTSVIFVMSKALSPASCCMAAFNSFMKPESCIVSFFKRSAPMSSGRTLQKVLTFAKALLGWPASRCKSIELVAFSLSWIDFIILSPLLRRSEPSSLS